MLITKTAVEILIMSNDSNPNTPSTATRVHPRDKRLCPDCEQFLPVDRSKITVGDEVTFVTTSQSSTKARFSTKQGVVEAVLPEDALMIKYRGGSIVRLRGDVTPIDAPNALTLAFSGVCKCNQPADPEAQS